MNPFLIIGAVVGVIILFVGSIYFIVYYQHPDDKNEAYTPKIVVLLGFVIAGATVLMLPLDVANREGYAGCDGYDNKFCGGLNMEIMWSAIFVLIPVWVFVFIPFMTFFYEADDGQLMAGTAYSPSPERRSKCGEALCYETFVLLIAGAFFGGLYFAMGETSIPVQDYQGGGFANRGIGVITEADVDRFVRLPMLENATGFVFSEMLSNMNRSDQEWLEGIRNEGEEIIELQVGVTTFFANLMAFIGWFLFALFGGIGLSALPMDLILAYWNRPRHLDAAEYAEVQVNLRERVNELVEVGELLKVERQERAQAGLTGSFMSFDSERRKTARDERQAMLSFKQAVFLLEKDVEVFQAVTTSRDSYNPLIPYISLALGFVSVILSVFWFIHIIVYVYPETPWSPFLNNYFLFFDDYYFRFFGVLSVALFTGYLLVCAVKGCFKFGIRFFFFHIHPMIPGKTYMSSFMFNTALVLLCALPVVQFCQEAFGDYAAYAEIRQIFGVQVRNLPFFSYFWRNQIFVYAFMGLNVLTTLYLACKPVDTATNGKELKQRIIHASNFR